MSYAVRLLYTALQKLLIAQLILVFLVMLVYAYLEGSSSALAAGYGGGITLINGIIMAWRVSRVSNKSTLAALSGISASFGSTLFLMGIGMGVLKLNPLAILTSFSITHLGYVYLGHQINRASN